MCRVSCCSVAFRMLQLPANGAPDPGRKSVATESNMTLLISKRVGHLTSCHHLRHEGRTRLRSDHFVRRVIPVSFTARGWNGNSGCTKEVLEARREALWSQSGNVLFRALAFVSSMGLALISISGFRNAYTVSLVINQQGLLANWLKGERK